MILSGNEIEEQIKQGTIVISPFNSSFTNPNSYNLRLHNELIVYDCQTLDMKRDNPFRRIEIPSKGLVLNPGVVYLGRTVEYTETFGYVPMLEGRSSVGRLGICVHVTAGFGDNGFKGYWTLELSCVQPVRIYPYVEICQIYYHTIEGNKDFTYFSGKYQDADDIQTSRMYLDF